MTGWPVLAWAKSADDGASGGGGVGVSGAAVVGAPERRAFSAVSQAEDYREHVEVRGLVGPEEHEHRQPLPYEGRGHGAPGADVIGDYR